MLLSRGREGIVYPLPKNDSGRFYEEKKRPLFIEFYSIKDMLLSIVLRFYLKIGLCMVAYGTFFRSFLTNDKMSAV